MDTKHTEGPWRVGQQCQSERNNSDSHDLHYPIFWPDCGCAAHVFRKADAHLIAAAPELLKALQAVMRIADRKTDEFDAAHAAIAKALGKEQR